jgi:hypothetical protein
LVGAENELREAMATVRTAFERSSAKSSAAEELPYASDSYLSRLGVLYLEDPPNTRPWNITWAVVTVFSTVVVGLIDGVKPGSGLVFGVQVE